MEAHIKESRYVTLYILRSLDGLREHAHRAGLHEMAEILDASYLSCRAHLNLLDRRAPDGKPDYLISPPSYVAK